MNDSWKRNLAVPFFSQRENKTIWKFIAPTEGYQYKGKLFKKGEVVTNADTVEVPMDEESCTITSLAMVLNFLGVISDTPDDMMKRLYVDDFDRYVKYVSMSVALNKSESESEYGYACIQHPTISKKIAEEIYGVRAAFNSEKYTLDDVKKEIAAGFPVIVSCGITQSGSAHSGHYIVIRGFTNNGDVIINDPYGKATKDNGYIPVDEEGVDIKSAYGGHQETDESDALDEFGKLDPNNIRNNDKNNGENVVIRIDDFKRQMVSENGNHRFYAAIVLYDRRWSFPFSDYKPEWEVEGEGDEAKFVLDEESKKARYRCESPEVHFLLTNTCTPHLGIHLTIEGSTGEIHSIGSGQVIAAKLTEGKDEDIPNGSNCMLLVRHQIKIADTTDIDKIKVFFVLYMHLDPNEEISDDSSTSKTPYSFVNEMLAKRNHRDGVSIKAKLTALAAGELVILNDIPNLFLELREGDFIGHIGKKGLSEKDKKPALHLEIFSSTNIVKGIADFEKELDISSVEHLLDREEVFKAVKEIIFCDYSENICYYEYDAISPREIEIFFRHKASHAMRAIAMKAKSAWNDLTDFIQSIGESKGINTNEGEDTEEFVEHNIKPYLWWNSEITTALNKNANPADKFIGEDAYYYHPIHFLHWLMTNDEELYAKICPITVEGEVAAAIQDALEATLLGK